MRKMILAIALVGVLFAAALAQHAKRAGIGSGGEWIQGHTNIGGRAAPETLTWVFQPSWLTTSISPDYPSDPDSVIADTDGSLFRYATLDKEYDDVLYHPSDSTWRIRYIYHEPMPYSLQRSMLVYWPLDMIPPDAKVLSAKMYLYNTSIDRGFDYDQELKVVLDTIQSDRAWIDAATVSTNHSYPNCTWEYADSLNQIAWAPSLDDREYFHDYGIWMTATIYGDTIYGGQWQEMDLTPLVDAAVQMNVDDPMFWIIGEGRPGTTDAYDCGPSATASHEPFFVVTFARHTPGRAGYRFILVSDIHSNGALTDSIDAHVADHGLFLLSDGDINLSDSCDSTTVQADIDTSWGERFPWVNVMGNHEDAAACDDGDLEDYVKGLCLRWAQNDTVGQTFVKLGYSGYRETNISFDIGDVHYVLFDPHSRYTGRWEMDEPDSTWLYNDLAGSVKPMKIVFTHKPMHTFDDIDYGYTAAADTLRNWEAFVNTCIAGGADAIIAGHQHLLWYGTRDGIQQVVVPPFKWDQMKGWMVCDVQPGGRINVQVWRETLAGNFTNNHNFTLRP